MTQTKVKAVLQKLLSCADQWAESLNEYLDIIDDNLTFPEAKIVERNLASFAPVLGIILHNHSIDISELIGGRNDQGESDRAA